VNVEAAAVVGVVVGVMESGGGDGSRARKFFSEIAT